MEAISGDLQGIEVLKSMASENRDYLKFLITEARTNNDRTAAFKSKDGVSYLLKLDPASGRLEVVRAT